MVHSAVDLDEAADLARDPGELTWLEVSASEFAELGPQLEIHPQAISDAVHSTTGSSAIAQRTKVERFPHCELIYLFRADLGPDAELDLHAAPVIVLPNTLIAITHDRPFTGDELVARWEQNPQLLEHGAPALLYGFLDLIVDSYLDTVDALSEAVDAMEDDLFDGAPARDVDPRVAQRRSFTTRKSLVRLRRVTQPMRELVSGLMRRADADQQVVDPTLLPYFQDVYDHVLRVNDTIEGLRDLITTIYETRLALNDHSLNTVTRQLAAWAAIIAVPTAVTGFYGQNIPYPGFAAHSGFWTSTGIWVGVSVRPLRDVQTAALAVGASEGRTQREPRRPALAELHTQHLVELDVVDVEADPGRRHVELPHTSPAQSDFGDGLLPVGVEIRAPVAARHRVVLAQVLLVPRLETVVLHRRDDRPTPINSPSGKTYRSMKPPARARSPSGRSGDAVVEQTTLRSQLACESGEVRAELTASDVLGEADGRHGVEVRPSGTSR